MGAGGWGQPSSTPLGAVLWNNNRGLGVTLTRSDRLPWLQGVTCAMYLAHSRCLTNDRGSSWPPGHSIPSQSVSQSQLQTWPPLLLAGCLCAAPAEGHTHPDALTAGPHGHRPAASLGSVLLGPEDWCWGLSRTLILGQREFDLEVIPALSIVCCSSPPAWREKASCRRE